MTALTHFLASIGIFTASLLGSLHFMQLPAEPSIPVEQGMATSSINDDSAVTLAKDPTHAPLDGGYATDNGVVYCDDAPLNGAHAKDFTIITAETDHISADDWVARYAKDDSQVYVNCSVLTDADAATFAPIMTAAGDMTGYAADKSHVWWLPQNATAKPVSDDPAHFKVLNGYFGSAENIDTSRTPYGVYERAEGFAEDSEHIFYEDAVVAADRATFVPLSAFSTPYAKDKDHVYFQDQILDGADPATFSVSPCESYGVACFGAVDAQDKNHQYAQGEVSK